MLKITRGDKQEKLTPEEVAELTLDKVKAMIEAQVPGAFDKKGSKAPAKKSKAPSKATKAPAKKTKAPVVKKAPAKKGAPAKKVAKKAAKKRK